MHKLYKNVKFHLEEKGDLEIQLGYITTESSWLEVKPFFIDNGNGWLVERAHPYQQTQFILNDCVSCWLVSFDNNGTIISVKKYFNSHNAPASFLIPETYVVLLPINTSLPIAKVVSLELKTE